MKKLKIFIERHNKRLTMFGSAVLLILGLVEVFFTLEVNVTSNDECLWVQKPAGEDSTIVIFEFVKVDGVAWKAGIRNGDQLLEINGKQAINTFVLQAELNKFNSGTYAPYKVKKPDGQILDTKIQIKKLVQFPLLSMDLLGVIWLIIGFIVIMAKPDGTVQKLFFRIGAALVLGLSIFILNAQVTPIYVNIVIDFLWSYAACFLPFMILKFFWTFPRPYKFMQKKITHKLLFYIPLTIFIISYLYRLIFIYRQLTPGTKFYPTFTAVLFFFAMVAFISGMFFLFFNYIKIKNSDERRPVFVILVSYILGVASIFYTLFIAPAISDTIFNSPEYYTPIILLLLVPISFAYSIFRYQLMDVSVVVKNTIIYGAATISIAAMYFLIIYIIGQTISSAIGTQYQGIIAGCVFIVFSVVFQSTKDKFQDFLTEKFYPEQFAYQRVLISFINDISVPQDGIGMEPILDTMKKTFVHALRLKQFGIMLRDEKASTAEADSFHLHRSEGISAVSLNLTSAELKNHIEAKQKVEKMPVIERDDFAAVFPEQKDILLQESIYTIIPMLVKSKPVGLLLFGLKHSGSQFAGKDLELLNAAAGQAAISIENARLYKSESEKLKIERDLDLARRIQQGLLPKAIPSLSGLDICGQMIPAMQVGGDYFDLIPVSESKLFVVVGDVSGKGLSAALYMTKLQTMMQLACTPGRSPKEVLIEVNRRMYESMERSWFVTMTLALFDTAEKKVQFCRAGHAPILLAQDGKVTLHKTNGIGVGLEKGKIFERTLTEQEEPLYAGQLYAFFSDGISEAMNEVQDLYGEEKLSETILCKSKERAADIVNGIWNELTTYRGEAEQNDDMTLVVVKVI